MDNIIDNSILSDYSDFEGDCYSVKSGFEIECQMSCPEGIMVQIFAAYTGDNAPKIQFELYVGVQTEPLYQSHRYSIGKKDEFSCKSWQIPPMIFADMRAVIKITVPSGTVLKIRSISARPHCQSIKPWEGGIRHNAHLGFISIAPQDTMPAFEMAAMSGFPACIVNPKVTADGVFVCLHDDSVNRTALDKDGKCADREMLVGEMTYEELCDWEVGTYKNEVYKGTKIPLLDDFFTLCEKTGMRPMFSVHPDFCTEQWQEIKKMLKKHGILKLLNIKADETKILKSARSVFGTEIEGYTWYTEGWNSGYIDELLNVCPVSSDCRTVLELRVKNYTEEIARKITESGLTASAWDVWQRDSEEYERLISYGVTEFTEDYHCSFGMNW